MAAEKKALHATAQDTSAAVDAFLATLEHPFKREVELLRALVLAADPSVADGIKWNAPSYRTTDYFATTHLRAKQGVALIFHLGAKVRAGARVTIDDPAGLLQWLGPDRAMATFTGLDDIAAKRAALTALVRQWIVHV